MLAAVEVKMKVVIEVSIDVKRGFIIKEHCAYLRQRGGRDARGYGRM